MASLYRYDHPEQEAPRNPPVDFQAVDSSPPSDEPVTSIEVDEGLWVVGVDPDLT